MTVRLAEPRRAACGMTHAEIRDAATETHKHCSLCGDFKSLEDFAPQRQGLKGRMAWCLVCLREYRAAHARLPEQRARRNAYLRSPEGYRQIRLTRMRALFGERGVQLEEARLADAPCEACGSTERVCLDHDHDLHEARGLLCSRCNRLLGMADDEPELLRQLAAYVEGGDAND